MSITAEMPQALNEEVEEMETEMMECPYCNGHEDGCEECDETGRVSEGKHAMIVEIPIEKSAKLTARLILDEHEDGYTVSYSYKSKNHQGKKLLPELYPRIRKALLAGAEWVYRAIPKNKKAYEGIHDFIAQTKEQLDAEIKQEELAAEVKEDSASDSPPQQPQDAITDYEHRLERATKLVANTALYQAKAEAAAKLAKAEAKLALEQLQKIIDRGPEHYPLFDASEEKQDESAKAGEQASNDAADESWREVEIGEIDVPDSILGKLIEAGIETVGNLADWSTDGKKLTDIDGIGAAKAEKIEAAMDEFWAERKETKGC